LRALASFLAAILFLGAAHAQGGDGSAREREIARAAEARAAEARDIAKSDADAIAAIERAERARLGVIADDIRRANEELQRLGPAPADGAPAEAGPLAAERAAANTRLAELRAQQARTLANAEEAARLLGEISKRRLARFYASLGEPGLSAITPAFWSHALKDAQAFAGETTAFVNRWRESADDGRGLAFNLGALAAALIVSLMLIGPVRAVLSRAIGDRIERGEPTDARRVALAGVRMLTWLVPGVIGGFLLIAAARWSGLLDEAGVPVARAVWVGLVALLLVTGFAQGFFTPKSPRWRMSGARADQGLAASRIIIAMVAVVGLKSIVVAAAEASGGLAALSAAAQASAAIAFSALLFLLCRTAMWRDAEVAGKSRWRIARRVGRGFAGAVALAVVAGFVALADFAVTRAYYLTLFLAFAWFARAVAIEAALWADRRLKSGKGARAGDDDQSMLRFWAGAIASVLIALAAAPLALALIGVDADRARQIFVRLFAGFRLGSLYISPADILLAVAAFIGVLTAMRFLEGLLDRGPLAHSRIDPGLRHSLTTLFGWFGLIIAAAVGASTLGVDLSNLALIAGALSVGIGFGLQSVVNNFVSGLILLFERPVKVGDWVVTNSGEGFVRRINIRSTEIETFDRSTIIVPNADLVSQTVTNFTHRDALGRVIVKVGVSYKSDPERVRAVLQRVAAENPDLLRFPEPLIVWTNFGESSLDFELRGFVSDITKGLGVRTELRFAIFRAFKEEGIEIPFPHREVFLRTGADTADRPPAPAGPGAPARQRPAARQQFPEDDGAAPAGEGDGDNA